MVSAHMGMSPIGDNLGIRLLTEIYSRFFKRLPQLDMSWSSVVSRKSMDMRSA